MCVIITINAYWITSYVKSNCITIWFTFWYKDESGTTVVRECSDRESIPNESIQDRIQTGKRCPERSNQWNGTFLNMSCTLFHSWLLVVHGEIVDDGMVTTWSNDCGLVMTRRRYIITVINNMSSARVVGIKECFESGTFCLTRGGARSRTAACNSHFPAWLSFGSDSLLNSLPLPVSSWYVPRTYARFSPLVSLPPFYRTPESALSLPLISLLGVFCSLVRSKSSALAQLILLFCCFYSIHRSLPLSKQQPLDSLISCSLVSFSSLSLLSPAVP